MQDLLAQEPTHQSLRILSLLSFLLCVIDEFLAEHCLKLFLPSLGQLTRSPILHHLNAVLKALHPISLRECLEHDLVLGFQLIYSSLPLLGLHSMALYLLLEITDGFLLLFD